MWQKFINRHRSYLFMTVFINVTKNSSWINGFLVVLEGPASCWWARQGALDSLTSAKEANPPAYWDMLAASPTAPCTAVGMTDRTEVTSGVSVEWANSGTVCHQRASRGHACSGNSCMFFPIHCLNIEEQELSGLYFMNINLVLKNLQQKSICSYSYDQIF